MDIPKADRPIDPDIFVTQVEQRRKELKLRNDELAGILGGCLLAVCDEHGIDALAMVMKSMQMSASEQEDTKK